MLVAALAFVACSSGESATVDADAPRADALALAPQDVYEARVADITTGVLLTGTLEPAESVNVTAQVGGTLGQIPVDRGSPVTRGQLITSIQAEGVRSRVAGAQASVAAAEAQLTVARTQRDAAQRLYQAGASSRVDAENAQAAYAAAAAQLEAARAQVTAASEAAAFTEVRAPISGTVSARAAEPGEAVQPGDQIVTIVNTSTLELAGRAPVDEAGAIRVGQPVTFTLDAFPGREFSGTVARKDPTADPSSRQVGVYVRLPNRSGEVTAGQYARGRVSGRKVEGAVVIPATAVQGAGAETAVFVIAGDRLSRRQVTLGIRDEGANTVAVTSGLDAGERILARPTARVADGQQVVIAADRPQAAPAAAAPQDSQPGTGEERE